MIGVHLKRIRKERHLSQEQVAQRLNISRQAISRWENDLAMPDIDNLVVLSRLYEVSIEELLGEKEVISEEETGTLIESPLQEEKKSSEIILACAIITMLVCSCVLPFAAIPLSICLFFAVKKLIKSKLFIRLIQLVCIIVLVVSISNSYHILMLKFTPIEGTIEQIN